MSTNNLTQSLLEDTTLLFATSNDNQLMVADGGSATLTYTLKVSYGTLVLGSTAGVTYAGNSTGAITLTGISAAINAAINGLVYRPKANYFGTDTLSVLKGSATAMAFNLRVAAVNDAPITMKPNTTQSFNENTPSVFNTASSDAVTPNGSAAQINTAPNRVVHFTLTESNVVLTAGGELTLAGVGSTVDGDFFTPQNGSVGLYGRFNLARNGSWSYATGTALDELKAGTSVSDGFRVVTANGCRGAVLIDIKGVNDAPVTTVQSASCTFNEDTALVFSSANKNAITVADVDSTALTTTVEASEGKLTLVSTNSGATIKVGANDSAIITLSGTARQINAALEGLKYTPLLNANGSKTLTVTTKDEALSSAQTITLNVNAVNDAPEVSVPGTQTFYEDTALAFNSNNKNAITVNDVDSTDLTTEVTINHGTLMLGTLDSGASITQGANKSPTFTLKGTAAQINNALSRLICTPNIGYDGSGELTVIARDGTLTSKQTIALIFVAPQAVMLSGAIAVDRIIGNATLAAFKNIIISNMASNQPLTATVVVDPYVTLTTSSGFSYNSMLSSPTSDVWTAKGTAAQIKTMLDTVRMGVTAENIILPGASRPFAMTLQVASIKGGSTVSGSAEHVEAGDTPLISMGSSISILDTATATPFSTFALTDPNAIEGMTVTVTVANPLTAAGIARGEFSNYTAKGFAKTGVGTYTLALAGGLSGGGVAKAAQDAVRALVYVPTNGADTSGTTSNLSMTVQARQGFTAANGVYPVTTPAVKTTLGITSSNRTPKLELNSTGQRVNVKGGTVTPFSAAVVIDTDSTQTVTLKVALDGTLGSLNNAVLQGMVLANSGLSTAYYSKAGLTPAAAQILLRSLIYKLSAATSINPILTVTVTDSSGSAITSSTITALELLANNPLTLSGNVSSQTINDSSRLTVFSYITANDNDTNQRFAADVVVGDIAKGVIGTSDWVFVGYEANGLSAGVTAGRWRYTASSLADLNNKIDGLSLVPVNNRNAVGSEDSLGLTLYANDGMTADVKQTNVTIISVNDAPTFSGTNESGISMLENQPARPFAAWQVNDPDAKSITTSGGVTTRTGQNITLTIDVPASENGYFNQLNGFKSDRALNIGAASAMVLPSVTLGSNFTLEARVRLSNYTAYTKIFDFSSGGTNNGLELYFQNSKLHFRLRQGSSLGTSQVDCNNTVTQEFAAAEHLYSVVVHGDKVSIYIDGVGQKLGESIGFSNGNVIRSFNNVGESNVLSDGSTRLMGTVRDMRIWNSARSGSEIASGVDSNTITSASSGLRGWWTLDTPPIDPVTGAYGVVVVDSSSYNQAALISGQPDWRSPTQYTFSGSRSAAEAALQKLQWVPQNVTSRTVIGGLTSEETTFNLTVQDELGAASTATSTVTVVAKDTSPGSVGTVTSREILETSRLVELFPNLEITKSDLSGVEQTVSATVSLSGFGVFKFANSSMFGDLDADGRAYHVSGTAAAVQAALANLRYDTVDATNNRFQVSTGTSSTVPITLTLRNQAGASVTRALNLTIGSAALNASGVLGKAMDSNRCARRVKFTLSNAQAGDTVTFDEAVFTRNKFSHDSVEIDNAAGTRSWYVRDTTDVNNFTGFNNAARLAAINAATTFVLTQGAGVRPLDSHFFYKDRQAHLSKGGQQSYTFSTREGDGDRVNLNPATELPYNTPGLYSTTLSSSSVPFDPSPTPDADETRLYDSYGQVTLTIGGWAESSVSGVASDADSLALNGAELASGWQYLSNAMPGFSIELTKSGGVFTFLSKDGNDKFTSLTNTDYGTQPHSPTQAQWSTFIGQLVLNQANYASESRLLTWDLLQDRNWWHRYGDSEITDDWEGSANLRSGAAYVSVVGGYAKQGNPAPTLVVDSGALALQDTGAVMPFSSTTLTDGSNPNETNSLVVSLAPGSVPGTLVYTGGASPFTPKNGGWYIASSTPATLQAALRLMKFVPTANALAAGATGEASFVVEVGGTANTGTPSNGAWSGGAVTSNTLKLRSSVTVTGANDAPWVTLATTSLTLNATGAQTVQPFTNATLGDPDPGETLTLVVTPTLTGGATVLGSFAAQSGVTLSGTAATLTGTAAAVQLALKNLSYTVPAGSSGNISFGLAMTDGRVSVGTATATAAPKALAFNGTSNYVALSDPDISGDITLEAWVNASDVTRAWQRIFDFGNGASSNNVLLAFLGNTGQLIFENYDSNNANRRITAPSALSAGWHHVAASISSTGTGTIYVDGTAVVSGYVGAAASIARSNNFVGKSNWPDALFAGQMRDIRVWDAERSQAQIQAQMGVWNASAPESASAAGLKTWIAVTDAGASTNNSQWPGGALNNQASWAAGVLPATQPSQPALVSLGNATVTLSRASGWTNGPAISGLQSGTAVWNGASAAPLDQLLLTDGSNAATLKVAITWASANGSATINGSAYSSGSTLAFTKTGNVDASALAQAALRTFSFSPNAALSQALSLQTGFTVTVTNSASASDASTVASVVQYGDYQRINLDGLPGDVLFSDKDAINPFLQTTLSDPLGAATATTRLLTARVVLTDDAAGGDFTNSAGFARSQVTLPDSMGTLVPMVTYTARGTASMLEGLLRQLSYRGKLDALLNRSAVAASSTAALRLELDEGGGQVATASFNLTNALSNQIPQLGVATSVWAVNEGTATSPFNGLTLTDADATSKGQSMTVYVQLAAGTESYARSKMNAANLNSFVQDNAATLTAQIKSPRAVVFTKTFSGSAAAAAAQTALRAFSFTPDRYHATPGQSSANTFSVWVNDGIYTSAVVSTTVNATAVNTAIGLSGVSAALRTVDGRNFAPFSTLAIVDPDMGDLITATLSLSDPSAGVLDNLTGYFAVASVIKDGNGNATGYTMTGVAATVMAALNSVTFIPANAPIGSGRRTKLNLQVRDAANTSAMVATSITVNSADAYLMGNVELVGNYAQTATNGGVVYKYEAFNGLMALTVNVGFAAGSTGAQVRFAAPYSVGGALKIGSPLRQADGTYYWDFSGSKYSQGNRPTLAEVQTYLRAATVQGAPNVQASFKPSIVSLIEEVNIFEDETGYGKWVVTGTASRDLVGRGQVTGIPAAATEIVLNPMLRWPLADLVVTTQASSGESNAGVTGLGIRLGKTAGGSANSNVGLVWPADLVVGGVTLIKSPVLSSGQWSWNLDGSATSQGTRPTTAQLQAYLRGVRIENYSADNATWAISFTAFTESIGGAARTAGAATLDTAFANKRAVAFVPGAALGGNTSEIAIYSADGTSGTSAVDKSDTFGQQVLAGVQIADSDLTALQTVTVSLSNTAAGAFSAASLGSVVDASGYFTDAGSGVYTYTGSVANANAAIGRLSFAANASVGKGQTLTTLATVTVRRPNSDGTTSTATPVSVKVVVGNQSVVFLPDAALVQKSAGVPTVVLMDVLQLQPFAKGALLETVSGYNAITVNVVVSDGTAGTLGNPVGTLDGYGFAVATDQTGLTSPQVRYTYTQPKEGLNKPLAYTVLRDAVFTPNQNLAGTANKTVTLSVSAVVDGVTSPVNSDTGFVIKPTAQLLSLAPSFSGNAAQIYVYITNGEVGDYVVFSDSAKYAGFTVKQIDFREWRITPPTTTGASNSLVTDLLNSLSFVNAASSAVTRTFKASVITTASEQFERIAQLTVALPTASATPSLQAAMLPAWVNTPYAAPNPLLGTSVDKLKAFKNALTLGMVAVRLAGLSLNFSKQTNLLGYMGAAAYLEIVGQNLAFEKSNKLSDWTEGYAPDPKKPYRVNGLYYLEGLANHIMYTPYFEVFNNMGAHRAGSVRAKIVIGAYLTDAINAGEGTQNRWTDRFGRAESPGPGVVVGKYWSKTSVVIPGETDPIDTYTLYGDLQDGTVGPLKDSTGLDTNITVGKDAAEKLGLREIAWRAEFVSLNYNGEPGRVRLIPYNLDRSLWYDAKYEKYVYRDQMPDGSKPRADEYIKNAYGKTIKYSGNGGVWVTQPDGTRLLENPLFQNAKMAEKQSRLIYATNILSFVGVGVSFAFFAMSAVQMKMQGKSYGEIMLLLTESALASGLGGPMLKGCIQYALLYGAATMAGSNVAKPTFYAPGKGWFGNDLKDTYSWLKPFQGYTTTTAETTTNLIKQALNVASREGTYSLNAAMKGRVLMTTRAALMLSMAANPITESLLFVASLFIGAVVAAQSGDPKLVLAALTAQFYTHVQINALKEYANTGVTVDGANSYMLGYSPGTVDTGGSAAQVYQYAAGGNSTDTLYTSSALYSTMFITGMGLDKVSGGAGVIDIIVGGFSGIDDKTLDIDDSFKVALGYGDLAADHAVYDGGAGSSNVLSLQDMGAYVANFEEKTYVSMGGHRINTVYSWLDVDVNLNTGTVWASGFKETDSVDTAMGFEATKSGRKRTKKIFSGVEIKNIDIVMGNNLNVTFTALDTAGTTSSYFGGDGNTTAIGGKATNKFVGGVGANVFFSGEGTNEFTTGLGLNDFNVGAGTEHIYITPDAGNTVIRYVNTQFLDTNPVTAKSTDDDELWFPVGITPMDLAFVPVEGKSLGVSYGSANSVIIDGFFNSYDQRMGKFVFSTPTGATVKMDSFGLVNSSGMTS